MARNHLNLLGCNEIIIKNLPRGARFEEQKTRHHLPRPESHREIHVPGGHARPSPRNQEPAAPEDAGNCSPDQAGRARARLCEAAASHLEVAHHGGSQGTEEPRPQDQLVRPPSDAPVPELVVTENADPGGWEVDGSGRETQAPGWGGDGLDEAGDPGVGAKLPVLGEEEGPRLLGLRVEWLGPVVPLAGGQH